MACPLDDLNVPTDPIHLSHYNTGWNDLANGLLPWQGNIRGERDPICWVTRCRSIASERHSEVTDSYTRAYFKGCIDCADHYLANGTVERR